MNQVVTELRIDSSSATVGSAAYVRAMGEAQQAVEQLKAREGSFAQQSMQLLGRDVPVSIGAVEKAWIRLEASMDPVLRKQLQLERELTRSMATIDRAVMTGVRTEQEAADIIGRLRNRQISDLERVRAASIGRPLSHGEALNDAANDNFRRQNLAFQLQDIGVSLYSGMPLATVLVQQGTQIAGAYAGSGGATAAIKDFVAVVGSAARVAGPLIAVGTALYGTYRLLASYSQEAALAVDDSTAALAAQAAPIGSVQSGIGELASLQREYQQAITATGTAQDAATNLIISATEREFDAKKALLELELKRQEAAIELQRSEMAIAGLQLQRDVGQQVFTRADLERQGFADARIGSVPFVRLPDNLSGLEKTQELIDRSPIADRLKEMRANLELTELAAEKLREALRATFDDGSLLPGGSRGGPAQGESVPIPRLRGIDDQPGNVEFMREFGRSSEERIRQLQDEAKAIGLTAGETARLRFEQQTLAAAQAKNIELSYGELTETTCQAAALRRIMEKLS